MKEAGKNNRIISLDADLILDTGLIPFKEQYPDRFVECGIAEQDMVSQAGGMALGGLLPVVHSFSCFLSARPNEQIYNNATEKTRIVYVGSLAGLLPGGPGHSHQAVRDISALSAVPGLEMIEPCCEAEVKIALGYCLNTAKGSTYLRLTSIPCLIPYALPQDYQFEIGKGTILRNGKDIAVIAYGLVMLGEAWNAAEKLQEEGLNVRVINLPWLNRIDPEWLKEAVTGCNKLLTLDNHYLKGGQGELVTALLAGDCNYIQVKNLGVLQIPECGTNAELLQSHGLDSDSIAQAILGF
jgi:transketolase